METEQIRKLQLEELSMFKEVVKLCERHGITYYALGGTLLGAVRHQGFIPWDDDLDIGIEREQYESFLKYAEREISYPYSIHHCGNDENYIYPYARIEDEEIKLRRENTKNKTEQPLWVDIFPLDGVPNSKIGRHIWEERLTVLRGLRNLSCFDELVNINREYKGFKGLIFEIGMKTNIQKHLNTNHILRAIDSYLKKYPVEKSKMIGNPMGGSWFKEVYPKDYYEHSMTLAFEDTIINCPEEYKKILTQMYGDYMTPPPVEQRNTHGVSLVEN